MVTPDLSTIHVFGFLWAGICGALIGLEREARDKGAGLRTHTLVSLGSCLFTVISIESVSGLSNGDPTRIAAQIVSGIGFLGGGAIIQERDKVHGLTTAATVWISAAIGMACGMGQIPSAILVTLMTLIFLFVFRRVSKTLRKPRLTWLLTIRLNSEILDVLDLEHKIENTVKAQGFRLLELTEKTDRLELVVKGRGKLSSLTKHIKETSKENLEIDLREL
ncbi:MAG: MgtC/SapB family protein [Candidatus Caenarcaniphilales bacterium]|nr:MgtC/SapB family protein [Candidatus Caenarcaniphilales bacterium]